MNCVYHSLIQRGFQYYKECREAIEVTDAVFFDKQLLEFQCALAYMYPTTVIC